MKPRGMVVLWLAMLGWAFGHLTFGSLGKADVFFSNPTPIQSADRVSKTRTVFDWQTQSLVFDFAIQNSVSTLGGGSRSIPFASLPAAARTEVAVIANYTDRFLAGRLAAASFTPPAPGGTIVP